MSHSTDHKYDSNIHEYDTYNNLSIIKDFKYVSTETEKDTGLITNGFDIQVEIQPVPFEDIASTAPAESSADIRARVIRARAIQQQRFAAEAGVYCNAQMNTRLLRQHAWPDAEGMDRLRRAMDRNNMSARAFDRILRVARTIADLDASEKVEQRHIAEAIGYRSLDRLSPTPLL